jgi:hypothetical protein
MVCEVVKHMVGQVVPFTPLGHAWTQLLIVFKAPPPHFILGQAPTGGGQRKVVVEWQTERQETVHLVDVKVGDVMARLLASQESYEVGQ